MWDSERMGYPMLSLSLLDILYMVASPDDRQLEKLQLNYLLEKRM